MVKDYDPVGDAERGRQDRADDDELEHGSDYSTALAIYRKRYESGLTKFEQAQRKFERPIDEDRLAKVKARAEGTLDDD